MFGGSQESANSWETLFTLPKPRSHLSPHFVNIAVEGSNRRGERAYIDLMSVFQYFLSRSIPNLSKTPPAITIIKQNK